MRARGHLRYLFLACSGAVALGGCTGGSMQDLQAYVQQVKSRPTAPIEPIPEIRQIETFTYVAGDRPDPFSPVAGAQEQAQQPKSSGPHPDFLRPKEELEQFPLDSLRMVGTLEQQRVRWALVRSKDRVIHRVKAGNYLGQNNGQISRITENKIELTEIVPDGQGGYRERQASLELTE